MHDDRGNGGHQIALSLPRGTGSFLRWSPVPSEVAAGTFGPGLGKKHSRRWCLVGRVTTDSECDALRRFEWILMLPHTDHRPAILLENRIHLDVSGTIPLDLLSPVPRIG